MKPATLKAPRKREDLRIKHLAAYEHPLFIERGTRYDAEMIIAFVSEFAKLHPTAVAQLPFADLKKYYTHCVSLFNGFGLQAPAKEIEINGKHYELINLKSPPTGWVMDCDLSDFQKDPVRLACLCYVPKGTRYGEVDENDNLKHPASERHEDFTAHFPLEQFIYLQAFFLRRYAKYEARYMAIERLKRKARRFKQKITGLIRSILSLKSLVTAGKK